MSTGTGSRPVSYLDEAGRYVNGNRTKDTFTRKSPKAGAPCQPGSPCTQRFTYDPREKLTRSDDGHGGTTDYRVDGAGNVLEEALSKGGQTTRTTSTYDGARIKTQASAGVTTHFAYDDEGNELCQASAPVTEQDCKVSEDQTAPARLISVSAYDGKNRMASNRTMGAGGQSAKYSYDAFDRPTEQSSTGGPSGSKTTLFSYIGLTEEVAEEEQRSGSATGTLQKTKGYSFDSGGERTGMSGTKPGGEQKDYSYGQDAHGSTSQLIGEGGAKDGQAQAAYGYTPYGEPDKDLTSEKDPDDGTGQAETKADDPLNNYRYSVKRLDPASGQLPWARPGKLEQKAWNWGRNVKA